MKKQILIVNNTRANRSFLGAALMDHGYAVHTAMEPGRGMELWQQMDPDLVLATAAIPITETHQLLEFCNRQSRRTPLIVLSNSKTIDDAVTAMKLGAYDYLAGPMDKDRLLRTVDRALQERGVSPELSLPASQQQPVPIKNGMVGRSPVMERIAAEIDMVATTAMSVLITGESGTGKELVARAIHIRSRKTSAPFVRLNCAAIPRDLLESELFGHVRGAFTGATASRPGAFALASGGTIFLDEIGDMALELQPKLLHAVEEKCITPLGSAQSRNISTRVVAATNRDLPAMVEMGSFRSDLYHRLNGYPLHLPPLRQRNEDIEELLHFFAKRFCREHSRPMPEYGAEFLESLKKYSWPGNIRELRNLWERLIICSKGEPITRAMLPPAIQEKSIGGDLGESISMNLQQREKKLIASALEQSSWNQSAAARKLGITRNTIRYRMKKHGLRQPH